MSGQISHYSKSPQEPCPRCGQEKAIDCAFPRHSICAECNQSLEKTGATDDGSHTNDPVPKAPRINILVKADELHAGLKAVCIQLLPSWHCLNNENIEVSVISGGISNALYKVSHDASTALDPVAVRIYGENTEKFVDREREVKMMEMLHSYGFGPAILGVFDHGRIESFLPMRCLTPDEMASATFAPAIAATLARFHAVPADNRPHTVEEAVTPFGRIREWLGVARQLDFSRNEPQAAKYATFDFDVMERELERVQIFAASLNSPVVFSHNDLLSGNIMVRSPSTEGPLKDRGFSRGIFRKDVNNTSTSPPVPNVQETIMTFIDFEYADWAPRGFDWGNHFCEYAGFECDYSQYPSYETAATFLRAYLSAADASLYPTVEAVPEAVVAAAVREANVHALAAHMYWGTWAIMQANWSRIDFDYMGYAQLRWAEYYNRRDEFLSCSVEKD